MAATWKRQKVTVSGYKFDYVDVNEFHTNSFIARIRYTAPFIMALKSILMYMADISILILTFMWMSEGNEKCDLKHSSSLSLTGSYCQRQNSRSQKIIPLEIRPYIILASVGLSFILLLLDWKKAWAIIKSGDIAYAFTSNIASRYYTLKSYPHFCFFLKIKDSRNWVEKLAFFVFFVFKGWKRLIFAEFPRQALNGLMIFDLMDTFLNRNSTYNVTELFDDNIGFGLIAGTYRYILNPPPPVKVALSTKMSLALQTFTVLMWLLSVTGLIIAFCIYLPLLFKIKGNLKEYCCHKIDVRLEELLQKKYRKKQEKNRKQMEFGEAGSRHSGSSSGFGSKYGNDQNYNQHPPPPGSYDHKQHYVAYDQQTSYSGDDPYRQNFYPQQQHYQDPRTQYAPQHQPQHYRDNYSEEPSYYYSQQPGYSNQHQVPEGYDNYQRSQSPYQRQQHYQQYSDDGHRPYERSGSRQGPQTPSDTTYVEEYVPTPRQRQYGEEYELQPPRQPHQYRQPY